MGLFAVLMGDIVNSRQATDIKAMHKSFNQIVAEVNDVFEGKIVSPMTITLGDEFQGIMLDLSYAFAAARYFRARLAQKNITCRFVIGTVKLETEINEDKAWNMMGEGLAEARFKLGNKKEKNYYQFSLEKKMINIEDLLDAVGRSLSFVEEKWTEKQKENVQAVVLNSFQKRKSKKALAQKKQVSENSLYVSLRSAHYQFYETQTAVIEKVLGRLDKRRQKTL